MNNKEIKKLRRKRKGKISKIQSYFDTHYPSLKLKYCIGTTMKIKCDGKTIFSFSIPDVIGNKLKTIYKLNPNRFSFIDQATFQELLRRLKIDFNLDDVADYTVISVPKYVLAIRAIELQLLKKGKLKITPKLRRKKL